MAEVVNQEARFESRHLISRAQVLRIGQVIASNAEFDRDRAIEFAERLLAGYADTLQPAIQNLLLDTAPVIGLKASDAPILNRYRRIIVNFPTFASPDGVDPFTLSLSCTVCDGSSHSKLWVKISHLEEQRILAAQIGQSLLDTLFEYYSATAEAFDTKLSFERGYGFEILGAHSTDEGIASIQSSLSTNSNPERAIQDILWKERDITLARVFHYVTGNDASQSRDDLKAAWAKFNRRDRGQLRLIAPITIQENDGVVVVQTNPKKRLTRAWIVSHDDTVEASDLESVLGAASQTTGKVASLLAADI